MPLLSTNIRPGVRRLGCFVDKGDARDLPVMSKSDRTTQKYCIIRCRSMGYKYASLQASDWCHCGNTYGIHGRARDSECNRRCKGNKRETCGGNWRNEIFTTGVRRSGEQAKYLVRIS